MANSSWNKKRQGRTSSSREESGMRGSPAGSEDQGDGFEGDTAPQGGMSGSSGTSGLGGETSKSGEGDRPGGVEGTSTRDGRSDPDRTNQR